MNSAQSLKAVAKIVLIFSLALLLASCGSNGSQKAFQIAPATEPESNEAASPASQAAPETADMPAKISIISLTSPANPGSTVSLFAKAASGWVGEIKVGYKTGPTEAQALVPKQVEKNGLVSWTWTIDPAVPYGEYPITLTAKAPDGSGSITTEAILKIESCNK